MSIYKTGLVQRVIGLLRRRSSDVPEISPATAYRPYSSEPVKWVNGIGFGLYVASESFPREQDRVESRKVLDLLPMYSLDGIPTRYLDDSESLRIETDVSFASIIHNKRPGEIRLPVLVTVRLGMEGYSGFQDVYDFLEREMTRSKSQGITE